MEKEDRELAVRIIKGKGKKKSTWVSWGCEEVFGESTITDLA